MHFYYFLMHGTPGWLLSGYYINSNINKILVEAKFANITN